jgi:hypothetical protein
MTDWGMQVNGTTAASPPACWASSQYTGGSSNISGSSLTVASDGTIVVTGTFSGTAFFPISADDSIALISLGGSSDLFVGWLTRPATPT